jgi:hypothetical protein
MCSASGRGTERYGIEDMGFRVREHDMEIMKRKEGIWRPDSVEECFLADDRLVTRTGPGIVTTGIG